MIRINTYNNKKSPQKRQRKFYKPQRDHLFDLENLDFREKKLNRIEFFEEKSCLLYPNEVLFRIIVKYIPKSKNRKKYNCV